MSGDPFQLTPAQRFEVAKAASEIQLIHLLPLAAPDEMVRRKQDIEHQLGLCRGMMRLGELLPYPFERAAILLAKAGRHAEEADLCAYVADWAERVQRLYPELEVAIPGAAKVWLSPRVQRLIQRQAAAERKAAARVKSMTPR